MMTDAEREKLGLKPKRIPKHELSPEGVRAFRILHEAQFEGFVGTKNMNAATALAVLFKNAQLSDDDNQAPNWDMQGLSNNHDAVGACVVCMRDTLARLDAGLEVDILRLQPLLDAQTRRTMTAQDGPDIVARAIVRLERELNEHYILEYQSALAEHGFPRLLDDAKPRTHVEDIKLTPIQEILKPPGEAATRAMGSRYI